MNSRYRTDTDPVNKAPPTCPGWDLPAALCEHDRCGRTDWKWFYAPDWEGMSQSYVRCMSPMCGQSFRVGKEIAQAAIEHAHSAAEIAQAVFAEPDWERYEPTEYEQAWEAGREDRRKFCSQLVSRTLPYTYGDRNGDRWQLGRAPKRCDGIIMYGGREGEGIDTEPLECDECGTRYDFSEYWDESALCPRHGYRLGRVRSGPDNRPRVCHVCEREKSGTTEVAVTRWPSNGSPRVEISNPASPVPTG